jgi:hypothetical protein
MCTERLKFYADTPQQKNKFFCFTINSMFDLEARLNYWLSKFYIRAAWYECKEDGKVISNDKIDLIAFVDYKEVKFIN